MRVKNFKILVIMLIFLFSCFQFLFSQTIPELWMASLEPKLPGGHGGGVTSVVFSSGGQLFASGSRDRTIKIWDTETGTCLRTLRGHTGAVTSVAYSPNGNYIVSGSLDSSTKIWKASTGECLAALYSLNGEWLVTTPNGTFDASEGALEKMYFARGLELIELEELKEEYFEPGLLAKIMGE